MAADRKTFIGGSDAPAILGVSPYASRLDVWNWKTGILDGAPVMRRPEDKSREVKNRGKRLEPYVIQMLADERGIIAAHRNRRHIDPVIPFLAAELDGETADGRAIEIKTVSAFKVREWGEAGSDELPLHYVAQVQHQMMVTGYAECVVGVLFGGDDFEVYNVARDDELIATIRAREIEFWEQYVLPRKPPAPANSADVGKMFRRDTGQIIQATPELYEAYMDLVKVRAQQKDLELREEQLEFRLKSAMEDASILEFNGSKLATWKVQTANRFDQKEFAAAHPALFEQFKFSAESRVFRLK